MSNKKYRIDFTRQEHIELVSFCSNLKDNRNDKNRSLWEKINNPIEIIVSHKKKESASKMASARWSETKAKVLDALQQLQKEGIKISPTALSERSGVTYVTAKKYIKIYYEKGTK